MTTPRRVAPSGALYTGTTAVPLAPISDEQLASVAMVDSIGNPIPIEQVVSAVRDIRKANTTMLLGFNTQPTFGGMTGSGSSTITGSPLGDLLINRGFDLATAILTKPSGTTVSAPSVPMTTALQQTYRGVLPGQDPLPPVERPDPIPGQVVMPSTWPTTKDGRPRRMKRNGQPWKRPSMNPANPRALGRAMRRVNGFATIAKRTISFTKRVRMKKRRRT